MIFKILFICYVLINISYCGKAPVLMWGAERGDLKPSLSVLSSMEFSNLIEKHMNDAMLVVFFEEELSVQDFSHCKIDSDSLCYTNLTQFYPKTYYASVEEPLAALKRISKKYQFVEADANGDLNDPVIFEPRKLVFINFEDNPTKSRQELLHAHDAAIAKIYHEISKLGKIVALYTSSQTNIISSRKARQTSSATAESNNNEFFFKNLENKFMIYFTSLKKTNAPVSDINIKEASLKETATKTYDIKLTDDKTNSLSFQIKYIEGYWTLDDLKWNTEKINVHPGIAMPEDFSYYCGGPTKYTTKDKTAELVWSGLQMQAFTDSTKNHSFGDAWHCVGFTSPGIWSGLFVSFLLLGILSIGIMWLMDIKTMDRFDDPKGKTITINTSE